MMLIFVVFGSNNDFSNTSTTEAKGSYLLFRGPWCCCWKGLSTRASWIAFNGFVVLILISDLQFAVLPLLPAPLNSHAFFYLFFWVRKYWLLFLCVCVCVWWKCIKRVHIFVLLLGKHVFLCLCRVSICQSRFFLFFFLLLLVNGQFISFFWSAGRWWWGDLPCLGSILHVNNNKCKVEDWNKMLKSFSLRVDRIFRKNCLISPRQDCFLLPLRGRGRRFGRARVNES